MPVTMRENADGRILMTEFEKTLDMCGKLADVVTKITTICNDNYGDHAEIGRLVTDVILHETGDLGG